MTSEATTSHDELRRKQTEDLIIVFVGGILLGFLVTLLFFTPIESAYDKKQVLSMDFTAELNNISTTKQSLASARWDLMIRVPKELIGNSIYRRQGNLQASFLYKNFTLATSSMQSYDKLKSCPPQLLSVSAVATGEDLSGPIGKEIMEAIKENDVLRFGLRLFLTDCRAKTMSYECNEVTLRFLLGSDQIRATSFENRATCVINP